MSTAKAACVYPDCTEKSFCRGFCTRHYSQYHKGWLTLDGQKTSLWNGFDGCRLKKAVKCSNTPEKKGFCSEHYKWFLNGNCTAEGVIIKRPRNVQKYKVHDICLATGCPKRATRKNFCDTHRNDVAKGKRDRTGAILESYEDRVRNLKKSYPKDWKCVKCGVQGKTRYVLGFCLTHYEDHRKGFIDFQGRPTGKKKMRVGGYSENDKCRVSECGKKARDIGFCQNHGVHFRKGNLDKFGNWTEKKQIFHKKEGATCSVAECSSPCHAKGLCGKHYRRLKSTGVIYLDKKDNPNFKNSGKTCSYKKCIRPAKTLTYCNKHYHRSKKGSPMDDKYYEVVTVCQAFACTSRKLQGKGLCSRHYYRLMHDIPMEGPPQGPTNCSVEGCDQLKAKKGMCHKHYERARTGRPLEGNPIRVQSDVCRDIEGCDRTDVVSRDLCTKHYARWRKSNKKRMEIETQVPISEYPQVLQPVSTASLPT